MPAPTDGGVGDAPTSVDDGAAGDAWGGDGADGPQRALGEACALDGECSSAHCRDGRCCDQQCDGQCEACDVDGSRGTCTQVAGAPHGDRAACLGSGVCVGVCVASRTACQFPGPATACRAPSCTNGVRTVAASCDGAGGCPPLATVSCGAYQCNGPDCRTTCADDGQCADGYYCNQPSCVPKMPPGDNHCTSGNQCTTGFCVDGHCCNLACTGQCEACDVAGSHGTCTQVAGAPHGPRTACAGVGECVGACALARDACSFPDATVQCRAQSCAAGELTHAAGCDGAGSCAVVTTTPCDPYACDAAGIACRTSCSSDADCGTNRYCNPGAICLATKPLGRGCGGDAECTGGTCRDGVCCDRDCAGQCEYCNQTTGLCGFVTGQPQGARAPCPTTNDRNLSCNRCTGSSAACVFATSPTACVTADLGFQGSCNGTGTCVATSCFAAGTPVQTAAGPRPIESVRVGDRVESFDVLTGRAVLAPVVQVERRRDRGLVEIALDGTVALRVTPEHHIWVEGSGWVRVAELAPGDRLLALGGGGHAVRGLRSLAPQVAQSGVVVYNLLVAGTGTYFVGAIPLLVHSCDFTGFSVLTPDSMPR